MGMIEVNTRVTAGAIKEALERDGLAYVAKKFIYDNLTEEELETAERIAKEFNESRNKVEHDFCYRVWVESCYDGEDEDLVCERLGMYERVFTDSRDADEYIKKLESELILNEYHPFESMDKYYDCKVRNSTIVFNWNNVKMW